MLAHGVLLQEGGVGVYTGNMHVELILHHLWQALDALSGSQSSLPESLKECSAMVKKCFADFNFIASCGQVSQGLIHQLVQNS